MNRALIHFLLLLAWLPCPSNAALHAIYRSNDNGTNWTRSDAGFSGKSRINSFARLGSNIFAGTDDGILTSTNNGTSWEHHSIATNRVVSLAALENSICAAVADKGLLISSNGYDWAAIKNGPINTRCLLASGGKLTAGTDDGKVFVSVNHGKSWQELTSGLPSHAQIFELTHFKNNTYAALYSRGLYKLNSSEESWSKIGSVKPLVIAATKSTLIGGHNPGGIFFSEGDSGIWKKSLPGYDSGNWFGLGENTGELRPNAPVWSLVANENLAIAGADDGIFISSDHGISWRRARGGLPPRAPGVAFLLQDTTIFAAVLIPNPAPSHTLR